MSSTSSSPTLERNLANAKQMAMVLLDKQGGESAAEIKGKNLIYLFWALFGSACLAVGSFIRGTCSERPLPAKFALSLVYLILSTLQIYIYKLKHGSNFKYPWRRQSNGKFSCTQFFILALGGICEFLSSVAMLMTLNLAMESNVNQGIATSIMIVLTVEVTFLSYYFFGETISMIQMFGIVVVMCAVALLAVYTPAEINGTGNNVSVFGTLSVSISALTCTAFSAVTITCCNWLKIKRSIPGDISGTFFMLIDGILGSICLVSSTFNGGGVRELTLISFGMLEIGAVLAYTGIVVSNYTISIGVTGIVVAIYNASAFVHVVLSALFLGQRITMTQILCVLVLIAGACFISISEVVLARAQ